MSNRYKRAKKCRSNIADKGINRLTVHRTPRHIYAQVFTADGALVLACASSLEKDLRDKSKAVVASEVGKLVAKRALENDVKKVAFDRSGFKYHGRIKVLADAAREAGLEF